MITAYILSQILAAVAIVVGPTAFLRRDDKWVKLHIAGATFLMAGHFMFLEAWVGAGICIVGGIRYLVASYWRNVWLFWLFFTIGTLICYWRYHDAYDLLPFVANYLSCAAVFLLSGKQMRLTLMAVTSTWIAYNAAHASLGGVMLESIYLVTNLAGLWKLQRAKA